MDRLIPSSGERRSGGFINLNLRGFKAGDRVLFEPTYGDPRIDRIDQFDRANSNIAIIDGQRVLVTNIKGRIPAGWIEAEENTLLTLLRMAFQASAPRYDQVRNEILRKRRIR